jgi:hypothetical protein
MLRIRGKKGVENYSLPIDEQLVIGWDNLLRGKFSKQWRIQQKAYTNRIRLKDPAMHARKQSNRIQKRRHRRPSTKVRRRKTRQKSSILSSNQ